MKVISSILFFCFISICGAQDTQIAHEFSGQQIVPAGYKYLLFLPENKVAEKNGKIPMIIFLHGAGERGDDIEKVKTHGPPKIVETQKDFPFIVLSPLCPANHRWYPHQLAALIDEVSQKYPVDTNRLYLTGLSMGGYGTWDLSLNYPNKFAAIAPVCGGNDIHSWMTMHIKHLGIWVFHGALDSVVPVGQSAAIVRSLKDLDADVRFTVYPEAGHDSWTETYDNPDLYEWFLSYEKKDK